MEMGDIPSERSIVRDTITIAWPSVLESFFVCLAGMMDTIMVGSLGSYAIAAVGLSTQPKFLGLPIFLSMNVAVSAVVARRRGEGDREGANRVVRMALLVTILLTVVVSAAFVLLAYSAMDWYPLITWLCLGYVAAAVAGGGVIAVVYSREGGKAA